jgi:hypothetical protein
MMGDLDGDLDGDIDGDLDEFEENNDDSNDDNSDDDSYDDSLYDYEYPVDCNEEDEALERSITKRQTEWLQGRVEDIKSLLFILKIYEEKLNNIEAKENEENEE